MGLCCTPADLEKRYPAAKLAELADLDGDGQADDGVIEAACDDVDDVVGGYLQGRYSWPMDPMPPVLRVYGSDLAVYSLFAGHGVDADSADKVVVDRYKDAIRYLEKVARGEIALVSAEEPTGPPSAVVSRTRTQAFDETELDKF